jgi:hypothetical protein
MRAGRSGRTAALPREVPYGRMSGVHTPELAHERVLANVRRAVQSLEVRRPIVDNDMRIWRAFHTRHWPAACFTDASGQLRFYHFGEGRSDEQEKAVV